MLHNIFSSDFQINKNWITCLLRFMYLLNIILSISNPGHNIHMSYPFKCLESWNYWALTEHITIISYLQRDPEQSLISVQFFFSFSCAYIFSIWNLGCLFYFIDRYFYLRKSWLVITKNCFLTFFISPNYKISSTENYKYLNIVFIV